MLEQGAGPGIATAVAGCWMCRSAGGVAPCNTRRRSAKQQDFKAGDMRVPGRLISAALAISTRAAGSDLAM